MIVGARPPREGAAAELFAARHGRAPQQVWAAPGRVNLIGEHTDYNEGFVLPLALPQRCDVAASFATGATSSVVSAQQPDAPVEFVVADLAPGSVPGWAAYVAGVTWTLREAGLLDRDVDLVIDSTVPLGASLSSSAAIECAVATAVLGLLDADLDPSRTALFAQRAENDFVGMPSGAMDQMASMHGQGGHAVFLDMRTMHVEPIPFDLAAHGLELLVIDTRAPHALVDGEYAARRRTCEAAAAALGVPALRDIDLDALPAALERLDDPVARRRVRHVVTEDARVLEVVELLRSGADPRAIGALMTASHVSLRDDFEVSVEHLDVAVDASLAAGAYGARMTGGGFGGSAIALVEADAAATVAAAVEAAYASRGFLAPVIFAAVPSPGAHRLS